MDGSDEEGYRRSERLRGLRGSLGEESCEEALCLRCCHTDESGGEDLPDGEYIGDVLAVLAELPMGRVSSTCADEALMAGGLIAEFVEDGADDGDGRSIVDRLTSDIGGDQLRAVVADISQATCDLGEKSHPVVGASDSEPAQGRGTSHAGA